MGCGGRRNAVSARPSSFSARWAHFYRRILPAYWIFLFCSTHLPKLQLPGPQSSDKIAHTTAFGILALLIWRAFQSVYSRLSAAFVWKVLGVVAVYGAFDEITQGFVGRGTDPEDWLGDMTGAAIVLGVLEWRRRARRDARPAAAGR